MSSQRYAAYFYENTFWARVTGSDIFAADCLGFAAEITGDKISGKFDAAQSEMVARIVRTKLTDAEVKKKQEVIPDDRVEDEVCRVDFLTLNGAPLKTIRSISLPTCDAYLVHEGHLLGKASDEFSIIHGPENHGCAYSLTTYRIEKGKVKEIIPYTLISTAIFGCDGHPDSKSLENEVIREKNQVFYLDVDPNDEGSKVIKRRVKLKP